MFKFASSADQQTFMSLKSLVNKNLGFFKSVKQSTFLYKAYKNACTTLPENFKKYMGIDVAEDQVGVEVNSFNQWADYGSRSIIPSITVFLIDKMGVVAQYKVRGNGNLRDGWGPDPKKTELLWSRPVDAVCPWSFDAPVVNTEDPLKSNEWLGYPGDKIEVTLKFIRCRSMGASQWGDSYLSVFEDEKGNVVNVWKYFDLQPNELIKVKGTIKSTDLYKDRKQTTLIRVKGV